MTAIDFDEIFKQMVQEELERREGGNGMKSDPPAPKAPPSPQTKPSCPPPEIMCWENEVPTDVSKGDSFLYYHDFITEKEEKELTSSIYHEHYSSAWVSLKRRKLQQWGGTPSLENFVAEPLPEYAKGLINRICDTVDPIESINHILINEYLPGQGISRHKVADGPVYKPTVAILSLSSPLLLNFYKSLGDKSPSVSLCLHPRSLLVFYGTLYHDYYHGIEERMEDEITPDVLFREKLSQAKEEEGTFINKRKHRVSLTLRMVPPS